MKFSNFLFPASMSAADDGRIIDETVQEAQLTEALGFDAIWLAEHHFDGIVAYVDPVAFAAALATATKRLLSHRLRCITRSGWQSKSL
jgi:alkanesulfonate monooxygenase SsuD/methylene tetrahydromethanopterin reductase-like flavin-dependent oxidoreductase (luciferase family)